MSIIATPLKWVGSKARVMDILREHLPAGDRLVEPFAGSCAVMMNTDYPEYLIADINPDLINLYQVIKEDAKDFIDTAKGLFRTATTAESYYRFRQVFNRGKVDRITSAALFLYLNRHGYRGVCRYNRDGGFNVPYGNYASPYFPLGEIQAFAEKARRAKFICAAFGETLQLIHPSDVVYCDPPYIPQTPTASFTSYHTDGFTHNDQYDLCSALSRLAERGIPVIASNSDTHHAHSLYHRFDIYRFTAPRSVGVAAGEGKQAGEIIAKRLPVPAARSLSKVCDRCGYEGGGHCPDCGLGIDDAIHQVTVAPGALNAEPF